MKQTDMEFWQSCEGEIIANAYELEDLLGCGSFGGVFRAAQIVNDKKQTKRVAVKLMRSGLIESKELEFAINLPYHPNLVHHLTGNNVKIRRFPMFYLVMELGSGSLANLLTKQGKLTSLEAKPIIQDIAEGLQFLHTLDLEKDNKKCVHRDLKTPNILRVGNTWKIADFGLAKALDSSTMLSS